MTNTDIATSFLGRNLDEVRAEQRQLRQISVDMLVDLMGLTVADARLRVVRSMRADKAKVDDLGCRNALIAAREGVDVALRAEWGV